MCTAGNQTTLPNFRNKNCEVRRRYNDFVWLRAHIKEKMDERGKRLTIAELPGNTFLSMFGTGTEIEGGEAMNICWLLFGPFWAMGVGLRDAERGTDAIDDVCDD